MKKPAAQHDDETAIEFLRRVVSNCNHEHEGILSQLPTVEAVLDYFALWHTYGTEFWTGILEGIAEGDDPGPARAFVRRWKLGTIWLDDISHSVRLSKLEASRP